ncbi:MAG: bifunctional diaminohydroxyphosphoribosylaminopyrimidine deaminase/5-amino-6-(5-phosphoribosylamino)uracil reductase RibD, partial [Elusimicrobiota bacterium]
MDEKYLRIALELAKKGAGFVSPNPMVGCVIVKNDKIIGRGYHCCFGEPHAEINAIRSVRSPLLLKGSTMYVNLEPCSHTNKKTPPCVPEIIKAGIKKVTLSMKDPNPQVNGRGISQLKSAGIRCQAGLLEKEARELNMSYIKWITKNTPYVISKWAMSIDGKIATKTGDSRWISSDEARKYTHKLRGEVDAVMVGIGTVLKDNPTLTSRIDDRQGRGCMGHQPLRVLLDPDLKVPLNANIINKDAGTI